MAPGLHRREHVGEGRGVPAGVRQPARAGGERPPDPNPNPRDAPPFPSQPDLSTVALSSLLGLGRCGTASRGSPFKPHTLAPAPLTRHRQRHTSERQARQAREEDAASVYGIHWYTTRKQAGTGVRPARGDDTASVRGYTGTRYTTTRVPRTDGRRRLIRFLSAAR